MTPWGWQRVHKIIDEIGDAWLTSKLVHHARGSCLHRDVSRVLPPRNLSVLARDLDRVSGPKRQNSRKQIVSDEPHIGSAVANEVVDMELSDDRFARSRSTSSLLQRFVPGGAHTYAKGDDQFPEGLAPIISHGRGGHVWDVDGNEYIEYGSGLRSVSLGHAHPRVLQAVRQQLDHGTNFVRPSIIEVEAAQQFLATVSTAEMVKFAKNGSDVTNAAVQARTGGDGSAARGDVPDQPFFSTDDWFIGPRRCGGNPFPTATTVDFAYNDLEPVRELLERQPARSLPHSRGGDATADPPEGSSRACETCDTARLRPGLRRNDHRVSLVGAGAQDFYGITPDLSTFGQGPGERLCDLRIGRRRDLMELGGLRHLMTACSSCRPPTEPKRMRSRLPSQSSKRMWRSTSPIDSTNSANCFLPVSAK